MKHSLALSIAILAGSLWGRHSVRETVRLVEQSAKGRPELVAELKSSNVQLGLAIRDKEKLQRSYGWVKCGCSAKCDKLSDSARLFCEKDCLECAAERPRGFVDVVTPHHPPAPHH